MGANRLLAVALLRFVRRAPISAASMLLGITLGVTSVCGVHLLGTQIAQQLDSLRPAHLAGVTHVLTREQLSDGHYFELRQQRNQGLLPDDVGAMVPLLEGQVDGVRIVGTDWIAAFTEQAGVASWFASQGSSADTTVLNGLRGAILQGGEEGQTSVELGTHQLPVVGRLAPQLGEVTGTTLFVDLSVAQQLLARPGELSAVLLTVEDPYRRGLEWLEWLMPGMAAGFQVDGPQFAGWTTHGLADELPSLELARAITFNVGALGSLALLVAMLLIYQTAVIWLRRQNVVFARLFEIGVHEAKLAGAFILTLLVFAVIAAMLGVYLGQILAQQLLQTMASDVVVALELSVWLKGFGAALLVCLLGGWLAWRAEYQSNDRSVALSVASLVIALPLIYWCLSVSTSLYAAFVALLVASLLLVQFVAPALGFLRPVLRRGFGPLLLRIGSRETVWYSRDLAIAVAALALAIAVSVGVGLMVDSLKREFVAMLDIRLAHDLYVTSEDNRDLTNDAKQWAELSAVEDIAAYGRADIRIAGQPAEFSFSEFDLEEAARYGYQQPLASDEVLVSEVTARRLNLAAGDVVLLNDVSVLVVAIFDGFGDAGLRVLGDLSLAQALAVPLRIDRVSLTVSKAEEVLDRLEKLPGIEVESMFGMRAVAIRVFEQTFAITGALTLLSLVIAGVALFNALGGFRLNQRTTSELLNTLGLTRFERLQIDFARAGLAGVLAICIAVPLGIWMGWVLCHEVNPRAFGWEVNLQIHPTTLWQPVWVGALAILVAGLLNPPPERAPVAS